ncbi:T9SS type B sorting domain-containing protein [Flavobacteriaceae bacterium S0825]|uniref:T9SS type B sorting domain-containing protein n=1 Tax=Gaetbulibacter sp. S0825 TaxID=2720084 RepID=UPI00142F724B|nr:T9SS type B sorting domain-containing protein [Gaetbulibacter sp. S0825]MCK0108971.1 T9SS type B sorting domain-containing protein [Flavobacteriaceae bacterium S0825]NIX64606.1 T9SS type B sorting domain-containing protein [Gaetbulibacter sp. S0825]
MKKIFLILSLTLCAQLWAQNQAANWYFGYGAGIKFDVANGTVNSVNNGSLSTNEGSTSISDEDGNLLFYTDGSIVYNRNHQVMQNGSGLFGDSSSTQSALIVPKPDDVNIYYVFTVDNRLDGNDFGLNYSVVDMTLAGGLGSVTNKNVNLLEFCSEKISAVIKDCVTKSIWVITLASENGGLGPINSYHAFEVNNSGVNTTPVTSTFNNLNVFDKRGYLKLSPDGNTMVSANVQSGLYLYDFDSATGIVSNQQQLYINSNSALAYGVEFSPNSELLYVHSSNDFFDPDNQGEGNNPANHRSTLTQFNLLAPDIQASAYTVDDRALYRGGLQLGPNGKIYRALSATYSQGLPYLGVINSPNNIGAACNYQHNAVSLAPNNSSQGLPPFIQSLFNTQIDIIRNNVSATNLNLCEGDNYRLTAEDLIGATYTWYRDGVVLPNTNYFLDINQGGHYQLYIDPNNGDCAIEGEAYVIYSPNPEAFPTSLFQCDEDGNPDGFTLFNLNEANDDLTGGVPNRFTRFYESLLDAQNEQNDIDGAAYNNIANPQTIYVKVFDNLTGCSTLTELYLDVTATDANNAKLIQCDDDGNEDGYYNFNLTQTNNEILNGLPPTLTVKYYRSYEDSLLERSELGNTFTNTTPYNQTIYARVENNNACFGISEIELVVLELPNIEVELETIYCLNFYPQLITLDAGLINNSPSDFTYLWSTGETTQEISINAPGVYTVTVTNTNNCNKVRTINVLPSNIATIENIVVEDARSNNTITILVSGEGDYEYAIDNIYGPYQDSNLFQNMAPGFHTVFIRDKNNCGIVEDNVAVIGFPKFFTPNNDGYNDTWQIYGITDPSQAESVIYIFDRYGKFLKELSPQDKGWDGTFNGQMLPSSDYWFHVKLQDGRIFKSHFTLKR